MNQKFLKEKLLNDYGISVKKLDSDMKYKYDENDLTSSYSHDNKTLFIVQNPSQQRREEVVEIQVPYYNFTIEQILNNSQKNEVKVEKYLPRVWQNSQRFVVPSLAQFKVVFNNPNELYKVFLVTGKGVIRKPNPTPDNYQFKWQANPKIWNLNLPVFLPKNGWEINNFQQNFLTLLPNATIKSGTKTLTFIEIVQKKKKETMYKRGGKSSKEEEKKGAESQDESIQKASSEGGNRGGEKALGKYEATPVDTSNSTASLDPLADDSGNSTSNMS